MFKDLGMDLNSLKNSKVLTGLVSVAAFIAGYYLVNLIPPLLLVKLVAGTVVGFLCGLIPYYLAKKQGKSNRRKHTLWICTLSGTVGGLLLAIPASILLVVYIMRSRRDEFEFVDDDE